MIQLFKVEKHRDGFSSVAAFPQSAPEADLHFKQAIRYKTGTAYYIASLKELNDCENEAPE